MRLYIQCLLILKCLGIVISFCVLDKKKGWWLDCGIRDSYLLRLKDFGGLQANFNIGFGLGDEKGFPNSITKTNYNSKGGHHRPPPPPPEFIPAPAYYSGHRRSDVQTNPNRRSEFPYQFEVPATVQKPPPPHPPHRITHAGSAASSRKVGQTWSQISQRSEQKPYPYQVTQGNQRQSLDQELPQTRPQYGSNRLQDGNQNQWSNPGKTLAASNASPPQRVVAPQESQSADWQQNQRAKSPQYSQKQESSRWANKPQKLQSGHWSQSLSGQQSFNKFPAGGQNQRFQNSHNIPQTRRHNSNQQQSTQLNVAPQNPQIERPSNQAQRRFQQIGYEENNFRQISPSSRMIPPPPAPPVRPDTRSYAQRPQYFAPDQHPDYEDYDYESNRRDFQVFRAPKVTTPPTPTIGPNMAELLKLPADTLASSDDVPSFAAKKFVVREAPVEFYPPFYDAGNARNKPKIHVEIPRTNFYCEEQKFSPGIYADAKLGCKMFHLCVPSSIGSTLTSYLCPNGTLFDQSILQCNYWYTVDCEASINDYDANLALALSYRRINAAHLPLAGATDVLTLSLLSQNVNQFHDSSKSEVKVSKRMGKAFLDTETNLESLEDKNATNTASNVIVTTIGNVSSSSPNDSTDDKDVSRIQFVPSVPSNDDTDSWIPIIKKDYPSKPLLKNEPKRQNKETGNSSNKKELESPLSNYVDPETDEELMELIVEVQNEFKLKKLIIIERNSLSETSRNETLEQ